MPSDAELFTQAERAEISKLGVGTYSIFRLESPDADQGYPGKLVVEALVALIPPGGEDAAVRPQQVKIGSVVIIYRAMLDEKGKKVVTPVNLTQASENVLI
jgi:aldose 1-epimerase